MPTENQTISKDGLSQEVLDYIEGLEGENNTLASALGAATDELEKAISANSDDDDSNDIVKGLPAEVAELVKGILAPIQAENATLRQTVEGERDIRLTAEQIEKAATFGFGDSTELGEVLKSVNQNCGSDIYTKLLKSLTAAKEQAKLGMAALTTEAGSVQTGVPSSDIGKASALNAAATDLISKSGGTLSLPDAYRQLARSQPALFNTEGE